MKSMLIGSMIGIALIVFLLSNNYLKKVNNINNELQLCKLTQTIQAEEISRLKTKNEFLSKENKILAEQVILPRPIVIGEQKCKP